MDLIAVVIVLYNPNIKEMIEQKKSFPANFSPIIYVDNSDRNSLYNIREIFDEDHIIYIDNNGNKGIANALNKGCDYLVSRGYSWVLTLDQDSIIPANMSESFLKVRKQFEHEKIAIISPGIKYYRKQKLHHREETSNIEFINIAITSGSYINLKVYMEVNKFDDSLFIDSVDTDFCFRCALAGYSILRVNNVILDHQLGDTYEIKLFGKHFCFVSNHNYIRKYYIYRNTLFLINKYQSDFPKEIKQFKSKLYTILIKIIFFEKDKIRKFRSIYQAKKDFANKKFGKFDI